MSDVQFQEDSTYHFQSREILGKPVEPGMITFLVKHGIVKNEKQAAYILIATILVSLVTAVVIYIFNPFVPSPSAPHSLPTSSSIRT